METMEKTPVVPEELAGCEGFGVYGPSARIGAVEGIRWLVHVPVDQIDAVDVAARRLELRPGGLLAGPRRAGAGTPGD